MSKLLEIKDFVKEYENITALKGISFDVNEGEFLSILGPSGCGKTTLLRILIGIEQVDSGSLFKNGVDITSAAPNERNMGIVFQNYDLFPNMTVLQNVKYPLIVNKNTRVNANEIAMDIIKKVGLENFIDEFPQNISGGQQQRVAIARTLALKPDIILFDEPMSALDAVIKQSLRKELKRMQKEFNLTMIYITHDQEEAFSMQIE